MSVLIYAVGCDVCVSVCLLADDVCAQPNARFVRVIATLLPSPVIITLNPAQLCRPVWASPQAVFMYEARLILLWGEFPLNRFPEIWPFLLPNPSTPAPQPQHSFELWLWKLFVSGASTLRLVLSVPGVPAIHSVIALSSKALRLLTSHKSAQYPRLPLYLTWRALSPTRCWQ